MKLRLLLLCVLLALLFISCEMKRNKKKGKRGHGHHHHPHQHRGLGRFKDITEDHFFQVRDDGDDDDDEEDHSDNWLFELQEPEGQCNPNPCHNNGVCHEKGKKYKCDCPKPFKGKKCQRGPKPCKRGRCARGECVVTSNPPFFECKCKEPFKPPNCVKYSACDPSPCQNGGTCMKDGNDFDCACPQGFSGRFCQVGPNDCYEGDGESYRGNVSETDNGHECLYWNSHFILESGTNPFDSFENEDGLGPHNFCRNPDGDRMPWCFYRKGHRLWWDYCDVRHCDDPTDEPPTVKPTEKPKPTSPQPTQPAPPPPAPTEPVPPPPAPTEPAPSTTQHSETSASTEPTGTTTHTPEPTAAPTAPHESTASPTAPPEPTATPTAPAPTATAEDFKTCGQPQPKKVITRIYGGLKVTPGALPWQVSVQVRPQNSNLAFRHVCGGVLIESCWVLTAGHCISSNRDMRVVLGSQDLSSEDPNEQILTVAEAIRHENYDEKPNTVHNDIGLLKLSSKNGVCAHESQFVKTACLPGAALPDGTECTISGWGATENSSYGSQHLLEAEVMLISHEKCSQPEVYGNLLDNGMLCAGYLQGGVDSCQGDSGGPLTCKENNAHVVYGVVSWGDQCGKKNRPGVYTNVIQYVDWIKSKTTAASA